MYSFATNPLVFSELTYMSETNTKEPVDPRERFPRPPFAQLKMTAPGTEAKMHPHPDHGEKTYTGSGKLRGRAALITGGDSGIGRAVALCYAKEGADILFTCLPEEKGDADETVRLVEAEGRRCVALPGDIRQKSFCQHLVEQTMSTFGRLDILVNNAAFQRSCDKLEDFTEEDFDATFRTNVYGTFFMSQAAIPRMKPGSSVINTVSIQGYDPSETLLPYASTKAALINMTKTLAALAIKSGVRVNAVAPGPVWTPLIPATLPLMETVMFGKQSAFGRPAQPVEQAVIYVFLASEDASYVTGEIYSGGRTGLHRTERFAS